MANVGCTPPCLKFEPFLSCEFHFFGFMFSRIYNSWNLKLMRAIAAWESLCHFQSPKKSVTRHRRVRSVRSPHRPGMGIPQARRLNDSTTSIPWVGTTSSIQWFGQPHPQPRNWSQARLQSFEAQGDFLRTITIRVAGNKGWWSPIHVCPMIFCTRTCYNYWGYPKLTFLGFRDRTWYNP
jgi:hypothetical protein